MKKHGMVLLVYSIVTALYISLTFILSPDKTAVFWIGFAMALFSIALSTAVTMLSAQKRSSAFPVEIAIVVFSIIYMAVVFVLNILLGQLFKVTVKSFINVHVICLAIYAIITLLLFIAKTSIAKQNTQVNDKIFEMQVLIYEFEKIKNKLIDMQAESKKKALPLIDSLLDELKFSDVGLTVDVSDIDAKLRSMAKMLSAEVDNLIAINSEDLTSMEAIVNDIKKVVKDRNMQIKLMNNSI